MGVCAGSAIINPCGVCTDDPAHYNDCACGTIVAGVFVDCTNSGIPTLPVLVFPEPECELMVSCGASVDVRHGVDCVTSCGDEEMKQHTYFWDFGDGQVMDSGPFALTHDYSDFMNHEVPVTETYLTVTQHGTGKTVSVPLSLGSAAYTAYQMGYVTPLFTPELFEKEECPIRVPFTIENPFGERAVLNRFVMRHHNCDNTKAPNSFDVSAVTLFGDEILEEVGQYGYGPKDTLAGGSPGGATGSVGLIQPGANTGPPPMNPGIVRMEPYEAKTGELLIECETVPTDVCVIGVDVIGAAESGRRVRGSVYGLVGRAVDQDNAVAPELMALLEVLRVEQLIPDPDNITLKDLRNLVTEGVLVRTTTGWEFAQ